jgi:hypothetical protein
VGSQPPVHAEREPAADLAADAVDDRGIRKADCLRADPEPVDGIGGPKQQSHRDDLQVSQRSSHKRPRDTYPEVSSR